MTPYRLELFARWPDTDFNQHMRNAAYLGAAEDTRLHFLADHGFTMAAFQQRALGPVVVEDRLTYRRELALLERFTVELELVAITPDARRMKVRNTVRRADGATAAVIESVVLWLDLTTRRPVTPPPDLAAPWLGLARAADYAPWDERGA